jgi:hypothetical protein
MRRAVRRRNDQCPELRRVRRAVPGRSTMCLRALRLSVGRDRVYRTLCRSRVGRLQLRRMRHRVQRRHDLPGRWVPLREHGAHLQRRLRGSRVGPRALRRMREQLPQRPGLCGGEMRDSVYGAGIDLQRTLRGSRGGSLELRHVRAYLHSRAGLRGRRVHLRHRQCRVLRRLRRRPHGSGQLRHVRHVVHGWLDLQGGLLRMRRWTVALPRWRCPSMRGHQCGLPELRWLRHRVRAAPSMLQRDLHLIDRPTDAPRGTSR